MERVRPVDHIALLLPSASSQLGRTESSGDHQPGGLCRWFPEYCWFDSFPGWVAVGRVYGTYRCQPQTSDSTNTPVSLLQYPWTSAHVLAPLIIGFFLLVAFALWEIYGAKYPIFPTRLKQEPRTLGLTLVITFISGANFFSVIMFWPTESFNVYGHDPVDVGVRSLPIGFGILAGACIILSLLSIFRGHNKELLIISSVLMTAGECLSVRSRRSDENVDVLIGNPQGNRLRRSIRRTHRQPVSALGNPCFGQSWDWRYRCASVDHHNHYLPGCKSSGTSTEKTAPSSHSFSVRTSSPPFPHSPSLSVLSVAASATASIIMSSSRNSAPWHSTMSAA